MKWIYSYGVFLFAVMGFSSCNSHTQDQNGYQTNPGTDSSVLIEVSPDSASRSAYVIPDTIQLKMRENGKISWGSDSLAITHLQWQVQDSLLNVYLHSGKLPSWLDFRYLGTVTMGIRGAADDEIRQAQQVVINAISAKSLNMPYSRLSPDQQEQFRDSFPVLFQKFY